MRTNPLIGTQLRLWRDPNNDATKAAEQETDPMRREALRRVGSQSVAHWATGHPPRTHVSPYVSKALNNGATPLVVAYAIPNRDLGNYSAGGHKDFPDYWGWIRDLAAVLTYTGTIVVLEPDALPHTTRMEGEALRERFRCLQYAVHALTDVGCRVYIDAGHSGWLSPTVAARLLTQAGVDSAQGFALNVSNTQWTGDQVLYGERVSALTLGARYVVDTSRNGQGPLRDAGGATVWCNPAGRGLGVKPLSALDGEHGDGTLWVKTPWRSDGLENGGVPAGEFHREYAVELGLNVPDWWRA